VVALACNAGSLSFVVVKVGSCLEPPPLSRRPWRARLEGWQAFPSRVLASGLGARPPLEMEHMALRFL